LAAEIKKAKGIETTLIRGSGGVFEVVFDGKLIYSKKAVGRFPELDEILSQLPIPH
jgi:selenoprotein W-related protein